MDRLDAMHLFVRVAELGSFAAVAQQLGVPVHLVSADDDAGPLSLAPYLTPGKTIAMIGSSGAGKSTLVNRLAGRAVQLTGTVDDSHGKGRHTTTTRDLIILPGGGMIIDNPGIREIALWDDGGGLDNAFPEIDALAAACRFSDCAHDGEPGCAVLAALDRGEITHERMNSYRKMQRELEYQSQRRGKSADRIEKERWKPIAQKVKAIQKSKRGR